ncbi:hypothetical protein PR202_gb06174 [Eleusine coracana subsp. coracana]|uniref:KIB1-4 beta-propeller domain-containing protein n=1 Tax=Eleusine coracana subsp. coracana TaxID=191504 RepID=A0AAV5E786_ELECO|nr:hypothetical protein PR202_gb06174 [Eleusine coracana subsp. coracana]
MSSGSGSKKPQPHSLLYCRHSDPSLRGFLEDQRFHPRRWIMLLGEREELSAAKAPHNSHRHFLNVSTGQCIQVDVPELRDHGVLQSTGAEGLLLLLGKATGAVRLLNPLTRQMSELPPIAGLGDCSQRHIGSCLPSAALVNQGTVALSFSHDGICKLASAKPGDGRWVLLDTDTEFCMPSMLSFAGRFYGIWNGAVMVMDTDRAKIHPLRLEVAAKLPRSVRNMEDSVHLVDNDGKLLLVHRKMTLARGLGGRAVFLGLYQSLSVSSKVFPSLDADTVYPGLVLGERGGVEQIGAYHLRDGSTESFNYDSESSLPHPWSITDHLAAYVSS